MKIFNQDRVKDTASEIKEEINDTKDQVKENVHSLKDHVADKAGKVKGAAQNLGEELVDKAYKIKNEVKGQINEYSDEMAGYVKSNPIKSVLLATLAGVLLSKTIW